MISLRSVPFRSGLRSSGCREGFSLLELVITIAIIGSIVGVAIYSMSGAASGVSTAKLQSDIETLNHMINVYVADGGSVAGLTSPQAVLDKMKRYRPQTEWQGHVGDDTGKLLDVRLQARLTSQPDASNNPRVTWNSTKQRFVIGQVSGSAVAEFYLNPSLAGTDYGTETRTKSIVQFNNTSSGWVWGASATNVAANYLTPLATSLPGSGAGFDPNETAPTSSTPPTTPVSGGSGGGGGGNPANPTIALLPPPNITPLGGTFAYASFPTSVTIDSGGATPDVSTLNYSINGGPWVPYPGTAIPVTPAMSLQAQNVSTSPAQFASSSINAQTYYRLTSAFSGSDQASWGNALGGANLVTSIQNTSTTSTFQDGNTKLDLGNGQYLDAGVQNSLSFTPTNFASVTPNTWFNFGSMQITNGTTFYNSEATGVTLSVNLNLSQPSINTITHINLGLVSTANTSDPLASADLVQLINPTTDFTVNIDGVQYRMQLRWVSLDPTASVVQGNNLAVFEGATAAVELQASFTSNF